MGTLECELQESKRQLQEHSAHWYFCIEQFTLVDMSLRLRLLTVAAARAAAF